MELRELRYFATVVEAGSLTAAAAQLHLSQPSLSVAISRLEADLGTALLTRNSRGVQPTAAGRYLLDASTRMLGEEAEIRATLHRFTSGLQGTLTIAVVPVLTWHRLPIVLRGFAAEAPDVEVRLLDPPPWAAIDLVQQRRADAAMIMVAEPERFIERHSDQFAIFDWGEVPLVAVLPPGSEVGPLPIEAFAGQRMVLPPRTAAVPSLPEAVDQALRARGVVPAQVSTAPTIQTCLPYIEAGIATAILPDPDHRSLERFDVTVRRIDPEPEPLRALVLTRHEAAGDAALARLLRHLGRVADGLEATKAGEAGA